MKFYFKLKYFHSRNCVWICRLRNGGHFVQGRWVKTQPVFMWDPNYTCRYPSTQQCCAISIRSADWIVIHFFLPMFFRLWIIQNGHPNPVEYYRTARFKILSNKKSFINIRADSRLAPSQWEMSVQSNAISHWMGANLESTWIYQLSIHHDFCTALTMMTSSNGNIFRVTGHLCGEFTGHRWIHRTKASDAELWCFLWSASE